MTARRMRRLPFYELAFVLVGILYVSPLLLVLNNSLKTLPEINQAPLALPNPPTAANYQSIFTHVRLAGPMRNSLLMAGTVILCLITLAPMAAYSLVRRKMATGPLLRVCFLAGLIIPFQVLMVPLLQEFRFLRIEYTYLSLLLVYVSGGLPLAIFMSRARWKRPPPSTGAARWGPISGSSSRCWRPAR